MKYLILIALLFPGCVTEQDCIKDIKALRAKNLPCVTEYQKVYCLDKENNDVLICEFQRPDTYIRVINFAGENK